MVDIKYLSNDKNFKDITETVKLNSKATSLSINYYSVLEWHKGELVSRVFATRMRKGKLRVKEVVRKTYKDNISKDIYFYYMTGYSVIWDEEDAKKKYWTYSTSDWYPDEKELGMWVECLNLEEVYKNKYKYCGYTPSQGSLMSFLAMYERDPEVEYFGKLGIKATKSLIKKAKDKNFVRWLIENQEDARKYGPKEILYAYNHNYKIPTAAKCLALVQDLKNTLKENKKVVDDIDKRKLCKYIEEKNVSIRLYSDYIKALVGLGLSLSEDKNVFPHDFMRMHDLRTDEYASLLAKQNEAEKRKLRKNFSKKAEELKVYEYKSNGFCVLIPHTPRDLKREGSKLDHCVGRMGYDVKMAEGRSFIAFVRKEEDIETPFVTVEYGLKEKRVLQNYGYHDTIPEGNVLDFVKEWGDMVTKDLRKKPQFA